MEKDYLEFQCTNVANDLMFVSIGEYLCFECIEGENRAAITISKTDIEDAGDWTHTSLQVHVMQKKR